MTQRPVAVGLLLCEQVIVDDQTRNVTPVSCFTHLFTESPVPEPLSFSVLGFITDGLGKTQLDLLIHRMDTMEEIFQRTHLLTLQSPLQSYRLTSRIKNFMFPEAGPYLVSLLANGEMIAQRKFYLIQR